MKRLLTLATLVTLIALGCKPESTPEPKLTLTSDSSLSFTAEGGVGTITYRLENPNSETKVEATCNAEWITGITTATSGVVGFSVASNTESSSRSGQITVKYGNLSFAVSITQAAGSTTTDPENPNPENPDTPNPDDPTPDTPQFDQEFEAEHLYGVPNGKNYYIFIGDAITPSGYTMTGGTYYIFDIYADSSVEDSLVFDIPEGTYTFDPNNSKAPFTISSRNSCYLVNSNDPGEVQEELPFVGGTLTISSEQIVGEMELSDGTKHRVIYNGGNHVDMTFTQEGEVEEIEMNTDNATCTISYYGDVYSGMVSDAIAYHEITMTNDQSEIMRIGLLALTDSGANTITTGLYNIAPILEGQPMGENTAIAGSVDEGAIYISFYCILDEDGVPNTVKAFESGTVEVIAEESGEYTIQVNASCSEIGAAIVKCSWTGTPTFIDGTTSYTMRKEARSTQNNRLTKSINIR